MAAPDKPFRTDSILGNLPSDRQEQIAEWIRTCPEGDRYDYAREQLAADGVKVARTTVVDWFRGWRLRQSISSADSFALQVQDALKALNLGLTTDQLDAAGQLVFTNKALEAEDPKEFREMEYLRLAKQTAATKGRQKDQEIALAERRVAVLEKKISDAAETVENSKLSDAEKAARLREIFKR